MVHVTAVFEVPATVAVNCVDSPARIFAFDGVTVTIVEPDEDPGSEGDVGLGLVVVVFAMPPQAHAASARSSGSICTAECLVEQFVVRITLYTPRLVFCLSIFSNLLATMRYWTKV
jgi:hypothetical protein